MRPNAAMTIQERHPNMLDRIIAMLERRKDIPDTGNDPFSTKKVAVAALMVEGARLDRDLSKEEREAMQRIVRERFGLKEDEAQSLIDIAEARQRANYSDWQFVQAVKDNFSREEQVDIISMMWEVAYADGNLHRFEDYQIKSVAQRLGLTDAEIEKARADAKARLGIKD